MSPIYSVNDAVAGHLSKLKQTIMESVRQLLEQKHLYQSVDVEIEKASDAYQKKIPSEYSIATFQMLNVDKWPWIVNDTETFQALMLAVEKKKSFYQIITWSPPDIKLYCKVCDRLEPYNGVSSSNLLNRLKPSDGGIYFKGKLTQAYCLTYLCQSCKSVPEVFLIRKFGSRLTLSGRAPMEHVPVPKVIPRDIVNYYSDAVVAFQSGQILAALFLLRTLCEQWVRRYAASDAKADVALDKYMETLPDDFKERFPSLRTIYGELSAAIHSADACSVLFTKSCEGIEEHFSARSLFRLSGPS